MLKTIKLKVFDGFCFQSNFRLTVHLVGNIVHSPLVNEHTLGWVKLGVPYVHAVFHVNEQSLSSQVKYLVHVDSTLNIGSECPSVSIVIKHSSTINELS